MKIFFDTEFTGLHQETELISIGCISEDGQTYYAESVSFQSGFKSDSDSKWADENLIPHLRFYGKVGKGYNNSMLDCVNSGSKSEVFGEPWLIRDSLGDWLTRFDNVELWSDCLAYDFVLFNQLWGHAFNIPQNVYYIPFDICTMFKLKGIDPDISREKFSEMTEGTEKHNALWDAKVIKACYEKLINIISN